VLFQRRTGSTIRITTKSLFRYGSSMSGLPIVNENLKVSVGAARRGLDSAERRAAGKGARQRGEADPCRRAPFGDTHHSTGGGAETFPLVSSELFASGFHAQSL
jgi:hypothetical protein